MAQRIPDGPQERRRVNVVASYHVEIRRCSLGWRWTLLDLDQQVSTGVKKRWIDAQQEGESARREYVKTLHDAQSNGNAPPPFLQPMTRPKKNY